MFNINFFRLQNNEQAPPQGEPVVSTDNPIITWETPEVKDLSLLCGTVSNISKRVKKHITGNVSKCSPLIDIWTLYVRSAPHTRKINAERYTFTAFFDGYKSLKDYFGGLYSTSDFDTAAKYILTNGCLLTMFLNEFVLIFGVDFPNEVFVAKDHRGKVFEINFLEMEEALKSNPVYACSPKK